MDEGDRVEVTLYVALGVNEYYHSTFVKSLVDLVTNLSINGEKVTVSSDHTSGATKNTAVASFLESGCSHILLVDGDLEFSVSSIESMIDLKADAVAMVCPRMDPTTPWPANGRIKKTARDGVYESNWFPTNLILLTSECLKKIRDAAPHIMTTSPHRFFSEEQQSGDKFMTAEDYGFCYLLLRAGVTPVLFGASSVAVTGNRKVTGRFFDWVEASQSQIRTIDPETDETPEG